MNNCTVSPLGALYFNIPKGSEWFEEAREGFYMTFAHNEGLAGRHGHRDLDLWRTPEGLIIPGCYHCKSQNCPGDGGERGDCYSSLDAHESAGWDFVWLAGHGF